MAMAHLRHHGLFRHGAEIRQLNCVEIFLPKPPKCHGPQQRAIHLTSLQSLTHFSVFLS